MEVLPLRGVADLLRDSFLVGTTILIQKQQYISINQQSCDLNIPDNSYLRVKDPEQKDYTYRQTILGVGFCDDENNAFLSSSAKVPTHLRPNTTFVDVAGQIFAMT